MSQPASKASAEFEGMIKPHLDYLYSLALRLSGNRTEAEDVVQDALLKAFRAFPDLRNRERPGLWLARVLTSCYYDRLRTKPGEREVSKLRKIGFTAVRRCGERPVGIDDFEQYPVFTEELLDLMRRHIPRERWPHVALSVIFLAEKADGA